MTRALGCNVVATVALGSAVAAVSADAALDDALAAALGCAAGAGALVAVVVALAAASTPPPGRNMKCQTGPPYLRNRRHSHSPSSPTGISETISPITNQPGIWIHQLMIPETTP